MTVDYLSCYEGTFKSALRDTVKHRHWLEGLLKSVVCVTVEYLNWHECKVRDCRGVPLKGLSNISIGMKGLSRSVFRGTVEYEIGIKVR